MKHDVQKIKSRLFAIMNIFDESGDKILEDYIWKTIQQLSELEKKHELSFLEESRASL